MYFIDAVVLKVFAKKSKNNLVFLKIGKESPFFMASELNVLILGSVLKEHL